MPAPVETNEPVSSVRGEASPDVKRLVRGALRRLAHRIAPPELMTAMEFLRAESNPVFPKRNVTVTAAVPGCRVLVLSPHPDDEAIGMGGTLVKHLDAGSELTVLYLTDGGGLEEPREPLIEVRRGEARAAGEATGFRQVFWDHADTRLTNDARTVGDMARLLQELRPERVYAPSFFDTHFDHFASNQVLADALGEVPDLDPSVLGYEVWDTIPFANHLVDVSDVIERKDAVLAHYATPHEYTDFTALCRSRASVHFALHVDSERTRAGRGFAEAFLRFDAATYRRLLDAYVASLRKAGSELPGHLQS